MDILSQVTVEQAAMLATTLGGVAMLWWKSANSYAKLRAEIDGKVSAEDFEAHKQATTEALATKACNSELKALVDAQQQMARDLARMQESMGNVLSLVQETRQDVRDLMRGSRTP